MGLELASVKNLAYLQGLVKVPLSYAETDNEDIKEEVKENQREIIARDLEISGITDPEIIKSTLVGIESKNELGAKSLISKEKVENHIVKTIEEVKGATRAAEEKRKANKKEFEDTVINLPAKSPLVSKLLQLSNHSIKDVVSFMSDQDVSMDKEGKVLKVTKFQKYNTDMTSDMKNRAEKWVIQALLMMNDHKLDFITKLGVAQTNEDVSDALEGRFKQLSGRGRITQRQAVADGEEMDVVAFH